MVKNFLLKYADAGILFIRIGIGIPFVFVYGIMKIEGGPEMWQMVGSAMANIKINFGHVFFGFLASASEFFWRDTYSAGFIHQDCRCISRFHNAYGVCYAFNDA